MFKLFKNIYKKLLKFKKIKYNNIYKPQAYLLEALKNKYKNQDVVIIGMGPSLLIEDLNLFSKMTSFSCNKIYLAFDQTEWRPDYYTVIDSLIAEKCCDDILKADFCNSIPIHPYVVWKYLKSQTNALFYPHSDRFPENDIIANASLKTSFKDGLFAYGCTVVVDMIQICYILGFKRVFIVGLDFSFKSYSETADECESGKIVRVVQSSNHFHKDYYKHGDVHTMPRIAEQKRAFAYCRAAFERDGRKLINASRKSELDVLERVDFDKVFYRK
jgi:hypothetical protein